MKNPKELIKQAKAKRKMNKQAILNLSFNPKIDTFDIRTPKMLNQEKCRKILSKIFNVTLEETTNAFRICYIIDRT